MGNKQNKQNKQKTQQPIIEKAKTTDSVNSMEDDFILEDWVSLDPSMKRRTSETLNFKRELLISETKTDPKEEYTTIKTLGEGAFGKVFLVKHKINGVLRAMKVINKKKLSIEFGLDDSEIKREIDVLQKIDHPSITKIFEFYISKDEYILIIEYCEGGTLIDFVIKNQLGEFQIAYIMHQIFLALNYCHKMNILHRDLKPENILIKKCENDFCQVKICDFGTASVFRRGEFQKEIIGTPNFMAPEVLDEKYTQKCDLWSCGVTMYILCTRRMPFRGKDEDEIFTNILYGSYDKNALKEYSVYAIEMIEQLLERDPNKRISAAQALEHPLFKVYKTKEIINSIPKEKIMEFIDNLKKYQCDSIMQETALAYLVHNYPDLDDVANVCKLFNQIDVHGNGQIDREELYIGLSLIIENKDLRNDINDIFTNLDTDQNNYISYEEFIRGAINKKIFLQPDALDFAFKYFDSDNKGEITLDDLNSKFKVSIKSLNISESLHKIMDEVDTNKDGKINFEEFSQLMNNLLK